MKRELCNPRSSAPDRSSVRYLQSFPPRRGGPERLLHLHLLLDQSLAGKVLRLVEEEGLLVLSLKGEVPEELSNFWLRVRRSEEE